MANRRINLLLMFALAIGALFVLGRYGAARPSTAEETKRRWEYCQIWDTYIAGENLWKASVVFPSGRSDEIDSSSDGLGALNKLGADGWELVAVIPTQSNPHYLLKRPKP
jgi:hypothetical protein